MSLKETISSLDFFSKLNDKDIQKLSLFSNLHKYEKDYILYFEKQSTSKLFFMVSGQAKAYKLDKNNNEIFLYNINNNSLISEISNLNNSTITTYSNISLITDSQILSIDYKQFIEHFLDTNILYKEFTNEIIHKFTQLQDLIDREFIFDSISKVAIMIHNDLEMFNNLKRSEVSNMLNIQPETLSRVLNRLKRNKIIESVNGKISILNPIALEKIYGEFI